LNVFNYALDPSLPHSTTCRYHTFQGTYDTRPLAKLAVAQQSAGLVDSSHMQYYFSVCPEIFNASQFRGSCVGKNGRHVDAPSCQVTTSHFSYAIGRYPSFSALPSGMDVAGNGGFALTLWDGDASAACATRNMTIYFICDPDADVGSPTVPNGLAEHKACMYSFEWRSVYVCRHPPHAICNILLSYACPVCTMQDVAFDKDVCVNGNRSITAYWRPNSRRARIAAYCFTALTLAVTLQFTISLNFRLPSCAPALLTRVACRCFDKQRLPSRYFEPCEDLIVDRRVV
jgi:predicted nucleic acid-binding Zn ribbon protein